MEKENSTTPIILVIILVIIVGFVVWYVMDKKNTTETPRDTTPGTGLEINVGGSAGGAEEKAQ